MKHSSLVGRIIAGEFPDLVLSVGSAKSWMRDLGTVPAACGPPSSFTKGRELEQNIPQRTSLLCPSIRLD